MPCWTIQKQTVDLGIACKNRSLLTAALEILGPGTVTVNGETIRGVVDGAIVTIENGQVSMNQAANADAITSKIKGQYGIEAARSVAKQNGWSFKQTSQTKFQFLKRSL